MSDRIQSQLTYNKQEERLVADTNLEMIQILDILDTFIKMSLLSMHTEIKYTDKTLERIINETDNKRNKNWTFKTCNITPEINFSTHGFSKCSNEKEGISEYKDGQI